MDYSRNTKKITFLYHDKYCGQIRLLRMNNELNKTQKFRIEINEN